MPMFEPYGGRTAADLMKLGVNGGGQVLDLETAVKDNVLGGGDVTVNVNGAVICTTAVEKNPDLKKMIEELESTVEIPSVFICPISLEPMREPVTLCTGQTYERSNIVKWLSLGHFTCPTTMQELWDDSLTPNTTLQQLIHSWVSQKYLAMKKRSEDVSGRAIEVLESLKKVKGQSRVSALKELRRLATCHSTAKKTVVERGGVSLICSLLGPFTSHAVGSESIGILVNLELDSESRVHLMQPARVSLIVDMLNEGSVETKIDCTKLIGTLTESDDFVPENVSSLGLLVGLLKLVKDKRHPNGVLSGLRLLKTLSSYQQIRVSLVSIGAAPQLIDSLPGLNPECLELALAVLELLSAIQEGRTALRDCRSTIPNTVKLLMRKSEKCTESALSILCEVCKLAPEECASVAVEAGLAAKLLLVIQSGCSPVLKQRAAELLKLCSLNYTATTFISKCRLTRAIQ